MLPELPLLSVDGTIAGKRRIENLKPWKKGQSGNLSGRPKTKLISERCVPQLEGRLPEETRISLKLPEGSVLADAMVIGKIRAAVTAATHGANGSMPNEKKNGKSLSEPLSFP